jgi:uncharacterized protein YeaO (DUF488 family)
MALFTKCIFLPPEVADGIRISGMSRHTLDDGRTLDKRIVLKFGIYHMHLPILGPSAKLVGAWYRREISWREFEKRYLEEIRRPAKASFVRLIANLAMKIDVTLLCVEDSPEHCHRRLLAEECKRLKPQLIIKCR